MGMKEGDMSYCQSLNVGPWGPPCSARESLRYALISNACPLGADIGIMWRHHPKSYTLSGNFGLRPRDSVEFGINSVWWSL